MEHGRRVGDYEVIDELGRGGMGRVYRVRNVISDRMEAMKVLLHGASGSPDLAARFLREIKVLAALDHPGIAALRTALTADDQVVMIMELVDGEPLSRRLRRGPLPLADAVAYHRQVLAALAYAHERGVIHRDIKPANIMVTADGTIKLTDFGIARSSTDHTLTATGTTTGSLAYMSPEQVSGGTVDARSDLYSAGISLYEMLTGRTPFRGDSEFMLMSAHVQEPPPPPRQLRPDLPPELEAVVLRSIAKDPADRFQSAGDFAAALQAVSGTGRTPPPAADATQVSPRAAHRPPAIPAPRPAGASSPSAMHGVTWRDARGRRRWHPLAYVAAGAVLVIVAAAGTGSYLRRAEAGAEGQRAGADRRLASPADGRTSPGALAVPIGDPSADAAQALGTGVDPFDRTTGTGREASAAERPDVLAPGTPTGRSLGSGPAVGRPGAAGTRDSAATIATQNGNPPGVSSAGSPAAPGATTQLAPAQAGAPAPQAAAPAGVALELVDRVDQLMVRAASVNSSLDTLRAEQARQGVNLRGDMLARQESMNLNLSRAQAAIGQGNAALVDRYTARAQADIEALEKFVGR